MKTGTRPPPSRRARHALLWGLLALLGMNVWFLLATEFWHPEWRDPEFGHRLTALRNARAERPGRPLLLALGSSRTEMAFRPSVVEAALAEDGEPPLTFNFGISGSGPVMELLCLRRLLGCGIRPDYLVLEILPPLLHQEGRYSEDAWMNLLRLGWRDWRHIGPCYPLGRQFRKYALRDQL